MKEAYILLLSDVLGIQRHAAAAAVVNGRTYVLDQILPPLRYEEYISYMAEGILPWYRIETVYRVRLDQRGEPQVEIAQPEHLPPLP